MTHLAADFIRQCKQRKSRLKISDSTGMEFTGRDLLTRTLVLRRLLRDHLLESEEKHVGVLLPPSAGGVVVNMALALDHRIPVNLNYTVTSEVMNSCLKQAGIKRILTSQKFMDKMDFELDAEVVMLEGIRDKLTLGNKLTSAIQAALMPASMLIQSLRLADIQADDVATIIFTSGSTGEPKGVMLTYGNVASNVEAIQQAVNLTPSDTLVGVLPFFHSFGYTVTLWSVMALDIAGTYHFNPLDGKQIGKLIEKSKATLLLATPTFLRTYLRRCTPEQMKSLEIVVAGAEKLPLELSNAFEEKFGTRPVEGYGTTELSPLVSVNIPPNRSSKGGVELKEGTVGRPVKGVSAKIVDLDSGEDLGPNESGMLLISGPNVMKGYLGREDLTQEVIKDGWYTTGDVAMIDDDGFIKITGRQSRFSKIGGEMVPHIQIEETLTQVIGADEEEGLKAAVTAVPDAKKGERLIVIHTAIEQSPSELQAKLREAGLPNIYIPSADSFHEIAELPILGTGKLDLKGLQQLASEIFGQTIE